MSLIDQRILIAAPSEAVWSYVTDPNHLTRWNKMCKQISVLTTKSGGIGSRRRCTGEDGRAVVEQITAWFEHIGYEYVAVDGPYSEFKGRIRLQAVPEGTVVNWTIEYRLKGVLAPVLNVVSHRGKMEKLMADSMRNLRRVVESSGIRLDPADHARYAMQSAPSPELRATRNVPDSMRETVMRPVSVSEDDVPDVPLTATLSDSRPNMPINPAMAAMSDARPVPSDSRSIVPSAPLMSDSRPLAPVNEDANIAEPTVDKTDTKPRISQSMKETLLSSSNRSQNDENPVSSSAPTVPISLVAPPQPPQPETQTVDMPPVSSPQPPKSLPEYIPTPPPFSIKDWIEPEKSANADSSATPLTTPKDDTKPTSSNPELDEPLMMPGKEDTGQISIWDVFGVKRPSEKTKSDLEAVIASIQPRPNITRSIPIRQQSRRAKISVRAYRSKKPNRIKSKLTVRGMK